MSPSRSRIAFAVACVVGSSATACGTIAGLDVTYESAPTPADGGSVDASNDDAGTRVIVDSSFVEPEAEAPRLDPSDAGPCEADSDDGGGCDFSQGLGCCLAGGGASRCIFQWEIADKCAGGVFVGCRADDPTTESACCWRSGPNGSRMSALAASCDGGAHACVPDSGSATCNATSCALTVGTFTIGSTASPEVCPP